MHYLLYQSTALVPERKVAHAEILGLSKLNNQEAGITGFLIRKKNHFIQYLEGSLDALEATYARIERDPRHTDLNIFDRGTLQKRQLPDWQMAFADEDTLALDQMLELQDGTLSVQADDPFDLVTYMIAHADFTQNQPQSAR